MRDLLCKQVQLCLCVRRVDPVRLSQPQSHSLQHGAREPVVHGFQRRICKSGAVVHDHRIPERIHLEHVVADIIKYFISVCHRVHE